MLIDFINRHPEDWQKVGGLGLQLLWVSPLRALAKDIGRAMEEVIAGLGMRWQVGSGMGIRTLSERQKQKRRMPEVLIITPESLHLLLAQKGYAEVFAPLKVIAVDEWHELLGQQAGGAGGVGAVADRWGEGRGMFDYRDQCDDRESGAGE